MLNILALDQNLSNPPSVLLAPLQTVHKVVLGNLIMKASLGGSVHGLF